MKEDKKKIIDKIIIIFGICFLAVLLIILAIANLPDYFKQGFNPDKHICLENSIFEIKNGGFSKEDVESVGGVDEFVRDYNDRFKKYGGLYDCEWKEINNVILLACKVCGEWEKRSQE